MRRVRLDLFLAGTGLVIAALTIGLGLASIVNDPSYDEPGPIEWWALGIGALSIAGVVGIAVRHFRAYAEGGGHRLISMGLAVIGGLMALQILTGGDIITQERGIHQIAADFGLPAVLYGGALGTSSIGLLRDLREPAQLDAGRQDSRLDTVESNAPRP